MERILEYEKDFLLKANAYNTAKEIEQQPKLWRDTIEILQREKEKILLFLNDINLDSSKIIFTGAGTSEFIGNTLAPYLRENLHLDIESRATTDIVNNPKAYVPLNKELLLISFARSGNSPESVATVEIVTKILPNTRHIIITCNKNGKLANMNLKNSIVLYMPEESNDLGFAMTGSFSCMMLSAYVIFNIDKINKLEDDLKQMSYYLESNIYRIKEKLEEIVKLDTERVVFLGSSNLKGLAQELSLKLLELCAGKLPTLYDSPLAFRHGPKSILNNKTLVFALLSNKEYSKKYDIDLIEELINDRKSKIIVLGNVENTEDSNFNIYLENFSKDTFILSLSYLITGQIYAFMKSLDLGIGPDNPCPSGEVNRVVQGVRIYDYLIE